MIKKKLIVRDLLSKSEEIFVGDANRLDLEDLSEFKHSLQNDLVKKYFNSNALVEKVMKNEKSKEQQDLRLSQLYIEGKERARKISENEQKEKEIEERKKKAVLNRLAREEQLRKKEEEKKRLQESRNKEKEQQNIASSQNGTNLQKTRQDLLEKFRLLNRGLLDIEEVSSKSISQDNQSLLNNTKKLIEEKRTEVNNSSSKKDGLKAFQTKLESLQQEYDKLSIDVAKIKELLKSINNEHQQEPQTTIENDASHEQYNDQNISSSLVDGLVKFNVAVSTAANARLLMDTKNKIDQQKQGPKEPSSKTKQVSFVENTEKLKDNVIIHNQNFNRNSSSCTCLNQNSAVLGNAQDCVHCCIIQHKMSLMADDDIQLAESDASSGLQARSNLATNVVVLAPILTTRGQAEQLNNLNSLTNSCMGMRENPHVYSESCHKQRSVKKISNLGAAFYPDDYMTKKEAESCHKQRSVKKISNLGAAFYPDDYMTKKEAEAVNNR